jgi:hypothetical protein
MTVLIRACLLENDSGWNNWNDRKRKVMKIIFWIHFIILNHGNYVEVDVCLQICCSSNQLYIF